MCPPNWMFERIGVWTNTGGPFKQAAGSSWPFCVSKSSRMLPALTASASVGLLTTGGRRLLKYPNPPASFVLPSFPCFFALISCISCLFIRSRTLFFGSGAALGKSPRLSPVIISVWLLNFQLLNIYPLFPPSHCAFLHVLSSTSVVSTSYRQLNRNCWRLVLV